MYDREAALQAILDKPDRRTIYKLMAGGIALLGVWAGVAIAEAQQEPSQERPHAEVEVTATTTTSPVDVCKDVVTVEMVREDPAAAMALKESCLQDHKQGMGLVDLPR